MDPLRVACLGAGFFSQFHLDAWRRCDGVQVVGVADRDAARAQSTGAPPFTELAVMIRETKPDIVDIIVPPQGHAEAIDTALDAGVRTIICQKPFCTGLAQARRATQRARDAGATLIVHENFRFQPWYRVMRTALERGAIGTPLQLTFRLRPGDGQGPRAYLDRQPYFQTMQRFLVHETAVHWIDTFRFLFGTPSALYADLRRLNPAIAGEDAGYVIFEFGAERRALFDGNRLLDHAAQNHRLTMGECLIEGTGGTLTLNGRGAVRLRAFGAQSESDLLAPSATDTFGGDCVYHLQAHVVAALRGKADYENTADDYLAVMAIEDAIYQSAAQGRRIDLAL